MDIFLRDNRRVIYGVYVLRLIYKLENKPFVKYMNKTMLFVIPYELDLSIS